ncbi:MAG: transporter substrate-binding domain-containing protein [Gammaproteobacteria bacterium]|nr:transporter substrate-binding domain-containing protein [Gammaproteobacteria bacterium]MBU2056357.1 transporter substrate-binding domain-containing protein [Gammaproteobacteria bacterium]MBU2177250.1 transporter substrate-binding domain-containing protein [Gammaproteobacteria bacterium]MBU2246152.1 transporter substrate-binding domain-containing protein [Gammaproteobacteria bacterium]MBU2343000.1 transporter substrate-binding domain-containing protein [Gammaproteobacteria bacterium]
MMYRLTVLLFCFFIVQSALAEQKAQSQLQISTPVWPGFTNADGTGAYADLFQLIYPKDQTELVWHFSNFGRAIHLVQQGKHHMVPGLSAYESGKEHQGLLLSAHPFDFDLIVAIYDPTHTAPPQLELLKQHKLAWDLAYDLHLVLGLPEKGYEVLGIKQGLELVKNRRVDIYLAEKSELHQYLKGAGAVQLQPLRYQEMLRDPIYLAFADNESGRLFKALWDKRFLTLYKTGQLKQFYQTYPQLTLPTLP